MCDILEHQRATVSGVIDAVGLSLGTAHAYLVTLESRVLVEPGDETYRPGLELFPDGEHRRERVDTASIGDQ